jgi:hypothetical protein
VRDACLVAGRQRVEKVSSDATNVELSALRDKSTAGWGEDGERAAPIAKIPFAAKHTACLESIDAVARASMSSASPGAGSK